MVYFVKHRGEEAIIVLTFEDFLQSIFLLSLSPVICSAFKIFISVLIIYCI